MIPTEPPEIDVQTLLPRDIPFVETLAHIARMVCFRVVTHEVPEGMRAGDCNCYSCAAYNCLVIRYGHRLFSDLTTLHCSAAHGGRPVSIAGCDECDFICSNVGYLTGDGPMTDINKGLQLSVEMPSETKQ